MAGLRFTPERWGANLFRIDAPGGAHLLVRRHGSPELALWLPVELAPSDGDPFGLYFHADRHHSARLQAARRLACGIGLGPSLRSARYVAAHRQATMLCIHDLTRDGLGLRDIASMLIHPSPDDWRTSSERSDLRRLADAGTRMVAGDYRSLLRATGPGRVKAS